MLNNTDLANAVSEGIISADQAKQLQAFSKRVHASDDSPLTQEFESRDEPFRLLRGFRDIFISIGVLFLSIGATAIVYYLVGGYRIDFTIAIICSAALILLGIVLAEVVTYRLRLPLSSLYLSIIIALWFGSFGFSLAGLSGLFGDLTRNDTAGLIAFSFSAFVGISLFYLRYRLPFVVAVIAATLAGFVAALLHAIAPEFIEDNIRGLIGALGFIIFLAAMGFDFKDRLRVTRFSECGFWLHLIAAPMMIHAALANVGGGKPFLILSAFAFLTLIALIIDRRAILVSSLIYLAIAFYQIFNSLNLDGQLQTFVPIGIIGLVVVLLGVGWSPMRRLVISIVPTILKDRLPPVYTGPIVPASNAS